MSFASEDSFFSTSPETDAGFLEDLEIFETLNGPSVGIFDEAGHYDKMRRTYFHRDRVTWRRSLGESRPASCQNSSSLA
jgi:hypothetical protein